MTKSMTGFSRASSEQEFGSLVWEVRSVNHRYLDVIIKLPEELRGIEAEVRKKLSAVVKRGKVECALRFKPSNQQTELQVDDDYAGAILKACLKIGNKLHQPSELNVIEILKWPGVVKEPEQDVQTVTEVSLQLFDQVLQDLTNARSSEGKRLQQMIEERCIAMKKIVADERARRPQIMQQMRDKMLGRLEALQAEYDQDRFEQELAYIAQKMDVDEELDRLESHFAEVENIFKRDEPVGRRLDFIMQEFNREANTLGSKSTDIETTQASVELKVLIEQMREQVQNIE